MMKMSAGTHIALGQTFLLVSLFLAAILLGLVPDRLNAVREGRAALAEAIAIHSSSLISQGRLHELEGGIALVLERNPDLLSAAVRRSDGVALVSVGNHELRWVDAPGAASTDTQLTVPIWSGTRRWGRIELRFVAFGIWHGLWLGGYMLYADTWKRTPLGRRISKTRTWSLIGWALSFNVIVWSHVFYAVPSYDAAMRLLARVCGVSD